MDLITIRQILITWSVGINFFHQLLIIPHFIDSLFQRQQLGFFLFFCVLSSIALHSFWAHCSPRRIRDLYVGVSPFFLSFIFIRSFSESCFFWLEKPVGFVNLILWPDSPKRIIKLFTFFWFNLNRYFSEFPFSLFDLFQFGGHNHSCLVSFFIESFEVYYDALNIWL